MSNEVINEERFNDLLVNFKDNQLEDFLSNPLPVLKSAGIPTLIDGKTLAATENIQVKFKWWGVDIRMNEKLTQDIVLGAEGLGALTAILTPALAAAGVPGAVVGVIAAALAGGFILKIVQIKITDNGKGVHFPITWPQWASVIAAVPMGPIAVEAAIAAFIHPIRN